MATNAEITVTINGVTTAVKDFDELADVIGNVDKNVENLNDDLDQTGKKGKKAAKDLGDSAKKADKEVGPLQKRFQDIKESFKSFGADIKNGFSAATGGIEKFAKGLGLGSKAAKGLSISLAALGIPLLIAAVTALVGWFKNFEGAAKLVQTVMNSLGAVIGKLGGAFSKLIKGDLRGAYKEIKGIGQAISDAASNTNKLFAAQRKLAEQTRKFTVENAKLRQTLEGQRKILEDGTKSFDERLGALENVNAATERLAANQVALNKTELAALQAQLALENNYEKRRELQQQIADAQAALIESETELNTIRYDAARAERELRKEEEERIKTEREERIQNAKDVASTLEGLRMKLIQDEAEAIRQRLVAEREAALEELELKGATAEQIAQLNEYYDDLEIMELGKYNDKKAQEQATADKAAIDAERAFQDELFNLQDTSGLNQLQLLDRQYNQELQALQRRLEDEAITQEQYQQLYTATEAKYSKQREDIKRNEVETKQKLDEDALMGAAAVFGGVASLLGEQSALGQMAAISETLIQTYLGAQKAYTSLVGIPIVGPTLAAAAAGVAVAGGLKNVQAIQNAELPTGALGGYVNGPSHSMGGVPVELEGGEYVINRAAMQVPGVASMARSLNNVSRPKFQDGGIVPDLQMQQDMFERIANQPVKTYVTATDVTSAQEANKLIENLSRL